VTHGRDMRNDEQIAAGTLHQKGRPEGQGLVDANPTASEDRGRFFDFYVTSARICQ